MSLTLYYASDIHGSDVLWRKFVNAGRFYEAERDVEAIVNAAAHLGRDP